MSLYLPAYFINILDHPWTKQTTSVILEHKQTTILATAGVILGVYLWMGRRRLPPGPLALPVVGSLLSMGNAKDPYKLFFNLQKKYGNLVTIKIGSRVMILVFGHELIREAAVTKGNSFLDRPNQLYIIKKIFAEKGILWSQGQRWKEMRRFALMTMRDFGVGKKSLEERVLEEIRMTAEGIQDLSGRPFDPKDFLARATSNVICNIIFGARFEYTDQRFQSLLDLLDYLFKNAGLQVPENFLPWLRFLPIKSPAKNLIENDKRIRQFLKEKIEEHRLTFDPQNPRDFIDMYLKVADEKDSSIKVSEADMFRICVDLFLAGSETTATSLRWWALYMVTHPRVQERCWQDISKVVGTGRPVTVADKERLPYLVATISELQRVASLVPTTIPHKVSSDVELGGYELKAGDLVLFQIMAAHLDPTYWDQPMVFNPNRWIGPDGQLVKHQSFFPFGLGPRTCMGEPLASMELFLFSTNLLQRFQFKLPEGHPTPSLEGEQTGITLQPKFHQIVALLR